MCIRDSYWRSYPKSINQDKFIEWLSLLMKRTGKRKIALFMDNLRVHHTKVVKEFCKQHDITIIFNVPYYPDGNPIETIFSKVKSIFKSMKAQEVTKGMKTPTTVLVDKAFSQVTIEHCQNVISRSLYLFDPAC